LFFVRNIFPHPWGCGPMVTGLCHLSRWCHAFVLFVSLETRKYGNKLLIIRFAPLPAAWNILIFLLEHVSNISFLKIWSFNASKNVLERIKNIIFKSSQ
jgi:hypothetical protein